MMYMQDGVSMDTVFGDGSAQEGGWMGKLFGAGKRLLTGESMFTTVFVNEGQGKKRVAFAAASPGKIVPVHLRELGGALLAQKTPFCAPPRVCRWASPFSAGWAPACLAARALSCKNWKATAMCFCMPAARWWKNN